MGGASIQISSLSLLVTGKATSEKPPQTTHKKKKKNPCCVLRNFKWWPPHDFLIEPILWEWLGSEPFIWWTLLLISNDSNHHETTQFNPESCSFYTPPFHMCLSIGPNSIQQCCM